MDQAAPGRTDSEIIEPPSAPTERHQKGWFSIQISDPLTEYIAANLWGRQAPPSGWEAMRLSKAVYLFQEKESLWTLVVKFFQVKTGSAAEKYARREFANLLKAHAHGLSQTAMRAPRPLAEWRGALLLEYVAGPTLEQWIADRISQPETLIAALENAVRLLATLHTHSTQPEATPDFPLEIRDAHKYADELEGYGVLKEDQLTYNRVVQLIERWGTDRSMGEFTPALVHGDATSSNFILPESGGIVAVDWERMRTADPAFDLGRLMAEVSHSIQRYGDKGAEVGDLLQHLAESYRRSLPESWEAEAITKRARFYQAASTLRIARNGWLPREERSALVEQALRLFR